MSIQQNNSSRSPHSEPMTSSVLEFCQAYSPRYEFPPVEGASDPIRRQLATLIAAMSLLRQWVHLVSQVVVVV